MPELCADQPALSTPVATIVAGYLENTYTTGMTKQNAIKKAGGLRELAHMLGISAQAVHKWQAIPPLRLYQLRELRPGWFRAKAKRGAKT